MQELRDLCSQLHHAADYCETTFQNSEQKRSVVEHTREYICRAVVTVIDHLGCVSANLECCLAKTNNISETELRIDCLKQRLGTSQYYAQKLAVTRFYWSASCPRFHPRYLSPRNHFIPSLKPILFHQMLWSLVLKADSVFLISNARS
nr:probable protein ABIL5 [Ipomoea batatas]